MVENAKGMQLLLVILSLLCNNYALPLSESCLHMLSHALHCHVFVKGQLQSLCHWHLCPTGKVWTNLAGQGSGRQLIGS